jgi:HSP20 family molecular chaperone IbpA
MVRLTTTPYGDNIKMNLVEALDRIYSDAIPLASYPIPRVSQGNIDFIYDSKTGVYTATVDAAGADKTKFDVKISNGTLTVSYPKTEGFRCRSFSYTFSIGRGVRVSESNASYVDGVLTVTINTTVSNQNTTTIPVN